MGLWQYLFLNRAATVVFTLPDPLMRKSSFFLTSLAGSCQPVEKTDIGSLCRLVSHFLLSFPAKTVFWREMSSPISLEWWQISHSWFLAITCSCSIGFCSLVVGIHGLSVHPVMTLVTSAKCKSWHGCLSFMLCILTLILAKNPRSPNIKGSDS